MPIWVILFIFLFRSGAERELGNMQCTTKHCCDDRNTAPFSSKCRRENAQARGRHTNRSFRFPWKVLLLIFYASPASPRPPPPRLFSSFRWDSLLRCGSRVLGLSLSEVKMLDFCDALLRNNPETGNFGSLVALTVAAVDEVRRVPCAVCRVPRG